MAAYAIVQTGGKQYRVVPGDVIDVEKLNAEVGSTVELTDVRLLSQDGQVSIGAPQVAGARVVAEVQEQLKGPKVVIMKYKAKVRYRRKRGHRQPYTRLLIKEIVTAEGASQQVSEEKAAKA
jgi:large subunit ribosomal protein L21